ncbi:MAG: chondroitinase-B domain-containing protein [Geminicoccaceae bacterium]
MRAERGALDRRQLLSMAAGLAVLPAGLVPSPALAASVPLRVIAKNPPKAKRTLRVPESYPTVEAALAAARPGDHVSLRDGTYPGDRVWTASGSASGHIVVKARNWHKVVFTGRIQIRSPYLWLHALRTSFMGPDPDPALSDTRPNDDYAIGIRASHVRITRCVIASLGGVRIYDASPELADVIIAYNDFVGSRPYRYLGSQLFIGDVRVRSMGPTDVDIAYNYFDDSEPHRTILPDGSPAPLNERFNIYLGNSKPGDEPTGVNLSIRVHHNVIRGNRAMAIYMKRHVYIGFNYVDTVSPPHYQYQVGFRHGGGASGRGGIIEGNRIAGSGIFVNDTGARVLGNVVTNGGSIRLYCGAGSWKSDLGRYVYLMQAASDTLLVGNSVPTYALGEFKPTPANQVMLAGEGGRLARVRIHMAGRGTAASAVYRPNVPLPDATRQPGTYTTPYDPASILIDPSGTGGYAFPTAVTSTLRTLVGANA